MPPFYVIGHKNPDTDAICAAIGHAAFLRASGDQADATAACCGKVPARTAWVLERAGIPAPVLLTDVRTTAGMICRRDVVQVSLTDTFLTAYRHMLDAGVRSVPVVDAEGKVHGILRYLDLLELLLPAATEGLSARTVQLSLAKLAATLNAQSVGAGLPPDDHEEPLILLVGASSQGTVERRLQKAHADGNVGEFLVICGDRPTIQRYAISHGCRALIVTGDNPVSEEIRSLAASRGTVLLRCSQDTASVSMLIRCSRIVRHVMEPVFHPVNPSDPVSLLRKHLASIDQDLFVVQDPSDDTMIGVITKSDLIDPPRMRIALVDHNEYSQAVNGVEEAEIVEVIDHHRLAGDLVSREPIRFLNEPVGSTSTLVARKFFQLRLEPEAGVALCLCAGIISDTLCLTSPTTTRLDHEMLEWLSKLAGVDPQSFTEEFFSVGSLLATGSPEDILNADRKEFTEAGASVSISQLEESGIHGFPGRRAELEQHLRELAEANHYDLAVLAVTDITKHHSLILAVGAENILSQIPFERKDASLYDAPGVVSRKKQIFPAVCSALQSAQ